MVDALSSRSARKEVPSNRMVAFVSFRCRLFLKTPTTLVASLLFLTSSLSFRLSPDYSKWLDQPYADF